MAFVADAVLPHRNVCIYKYSTIIYILLPARSGHPHNNKQGVHTDVAAAPSTDHIENEKSLTANRKRYSIDLWWCAVDGRGRLLDALPYCSRCRLVVLCAYIPKFTVVVCIFIETAKNCPTQSIWNWSRKKRRRRTQSAHYRVMLRVLSIALQSPHRRAVGKQTHAKRRNMFSYMYYFNRKTCALENANINNMWAMPANRVYKCSFREAAKLQHSWLSVTEYCRVAIFIYTTFSKY